MLPQCCRPCPDLRCPALYCPALYCPALQCRMKDDIKSYLTSVGVDWQEVDDLAQVPGAMRSDAVWGAALAGGS